MLFRSYVKVENPNYVTVIESGTVTITKRAITLTDSKTVTYSGSEQTLEMPASAATGVVSGETLTFTRPATVKGTDAGTYGGTWTRDDPDSYDFDFGTWMVTKADGTTDSTGNYTLTITGTLTINPLTITVTVNGSGDEKVYTGSELTSETTVTATCSDPLFDAGKFSYSGATTITKTDVGEYSEPIDVTKASYTDTEGNFTINWVAGTPVTFEITELPVTVVITGNNTTATYDGTEHTASGYTAKAYVTVDGQRVETSLYKVSGNDKDFTFSGNDELAEIDAGLYPMGLAAGQFTNTNDNFAVTFEVEADGFLLIDKASLTITAKPQTYTYNGEAQGPAGTYTEGFDTYVTVSGLATGDTLSSITLAGEKTDVGEYANAIVPSDAAVTFGHTTDKTIGDNYYVHYVKNTLTIDPLAVTITAKDASKTFDNTPLTEGGFTVDGQPDTDTHTFTVTMTDDSTITNVGTQPNVIATVDGVAVSGDTATKIGNYIVSIAKGTLTITTSTLTATAPANVVYNGQSQQQKPATVTDATTGAALTEGTDYELSWSDDTTNVGTVTVTVTGKGNYEGSKTDVTYKITPRPVTINVSLNTVEKDYTGSQQEAILDFTYTCDDTVLTRTTGYSPAYDTKADYHKTGIDAGDYPSTVSDAAEHYTLFVGDAGYVARMSANFDPTFVVTQGKLVIGKVKVTITVNAQTYVYENTPKGEVGEGGEGNIYTPTTEPSVDQKVTVTGLVGGDELTTVTLKGSKTDVGEYTGVIEVLAATVAYNHETDSTALDKNYIVTYVAGDLTITKKPITVTITGNTATETYTGGTLSVSGYDVAISDRLYEASFMTMPTQAEAIASGIDVGGGSNPDGSYPMGLAASQFVNNNNNFDVTVNVTDGWLKITGAEMKLEITNYTGIYDMEAHTIEVTPSVTEGTTVYYSTVDPESEGFDPANWSTTAPTYTNVIREMGDVSFATIWVKAENPNYVTATGSGTVTITPRTVTLTVEGNNATLVYNGEEQSVTGYETTITVDNSDGKAFSNTYLEVVYVGTDANKTAKGTDVDGGDNPDGTYPMSLVAEQFGLQVSAAGEAAGLDPFSYEFDNSGMTVIQGWLKITPAEMTLQLTSVEVVYDGEGHSIGVNLDGLPAGSTIGYSTDGGNLYQDDNPAFVDVKWDGGTVASYTVKVKVSNPNYQTTDADATVTITPRPVTVSVADVTKTYTGQEQYGETTLSWDNLVRGHAAKIKYTPSAGTDVNTYDNGSFDAASFVVDNNGTEVTKNYTLETATAGKLTIEPAEMTLTVEDYSGTYDGNPHGVTATPSVTEGTTLFYSTVDPASTDFDPLADWSTLDPTYTDVPQTPVTVYVKAENPNYVTVTDSGTVTITKATITLTGSKTVTYTGSEQKLELSASDATGVVSGEVLGFQRTPTVKGTEADTYVGTYDSTTGVSENIDFGTWYVTKANGDESTFNYDITITGTLVIDPATMTLIATNYNGTYDGEAHTITVNTADLPEGTTVSYSEDGETWSTTAPTYTDVYTDGTQTLSHTVYVKAENPNYVTATDDAKVTISPRKLWPVIEDTVKTYNGETQEGLTEITWMSSQTPALVGSHVASIDYTPASGKDASTTPYDNGSFDTSSFKVMDDTTDVTSNYYLMEEEMVAGKLTIKPLEVTVTITGEQVTETYDATGYTAGYEV